MLVLGASVRQVQFVAQFPAGTSFRPKKTYIGIFRWNFEFLSTEAFQKKDKHFCYELMVLEGSLDKMYRSTPL